MQLSPTRYRLHAPPGSISLQPAWAEAEHGSVMQGHNCNCTKQEVADLVGLIINDDSDVVDVTSETSQPTQDICQDVPHGFVSEPRILSQCWHVNALQGLCLPMQASTTWKPVLNQHRSCMIQTSTCLRGNLLQRCREMFLG